MITTYRPTPDQALLLQAALLPPAEAARAWSAWKTHTDHGRVDSGSQRVMPLVARNLADSHVDDAFFHAIRLLHRKTWASNRLRLARLGEVLHALGDAGIDTLVLKGAALVTRAYPDPALRPMDDVDVLVPSAQAPAAIALLRQTGWTPATRSPEASLRVNHAHGFEHGADHRLDLHWHVLWECCGDGADADFWRDAVAIEVAGVPTRALDPTSQLLHVCVHGARWSAAPGLHWAADAAMILRAWGAEIDWARLTAQARGRRVTLPMRDALTFLAEALALPIPAHVIADLGSAPVSMLERVDYAVKLRPRGAWGTLVILLCHHARSSRGLGLPRTVLGLPRYLQHVRGLERLHDLPASMGRAAIDHVVGARRRPR